jgi:hypothetical protein
MFHLFERVSTVSDYSEEKEGQTDEPVAPDDKNLLQRRLHYGSI